MNFDARSLTPVKLTGTELEKEALYFMKECDDLTGNRYGVMTMVDGEGELRRIKSYPDIEGAIRGGVQFIIECKVVSSASFSLAARLKADKSWRQFKHLLERADFGCISFYLIHFNERELKTKFESACTYAFPVHASYGFWTHFLNGDEASINRATCEEHAFKMTWHVPPRCRKPRPNLLTAIYRCDNMLMPCRSRVKNDWRNSLIFK